jgi:GntR family transcriptional regulator/MocR family aminotransferase
LDVNSGPVLDIELDPDQPLGLQVERRLRGLVQSRTLPVGSKLPSTRALAADLGISRGVVVGAYAQLAGEGYIELRRGAAPVVAVSGRVPDDVRVDPDIPVARARATCLPDFGLFPRASWVAAVRASVRYARGSDFSYGEPFGTGALRLCLAPFLARTRRVVAVPDRTGIFAGSSQALLVIGCVLRSLGAKRIGVEDPGHRWRTATLASSGLEVVPVSVDDEGLRVDELPDVAAVVVSPDHQFPLGVALSARRRRALVEWASARDGLVIEHDYDGHYRYDRVSSGALQALAPEHVAYVGSASALLAPALRLGWAVLPARLVESVAHELFSTAIGGPRLTQLALAEFISRGHLDRHLRRTAAAFKRRREALLEALEEHFPEAALEGTAGGLFLSVRLPAEIEEAALVGAARRRGVAVDGVNEHACSPRPPGLALGFAAAPEPALRRGAKLLGAARDEVLGESR